MNRKTIETIRFLATDGVQKANSGHPGLPMGTATMAFSLWKEFLKITSKDPKWIDRDRFILSAGHGSMLIYSLLHLFGYNMSIEDIKQFRQMGSITPGHPEYGMTEGVETTTGPLGQGISNAVGFAIAESHLAAKFNKENYKVIDHYTYVIAGDGDLMEGVASEACSLAGHLGLDKLIVLYDDNQITIDGSTDITFTEDVKKRYEAYGWQVLEVSDGNDYKLIVNAINEAKNNNSQPTLIKVKTIIGYGSPAKAGKSAAHGSPLGEKEIKITKEKFGWDPDKKFFVPDEVYESMDGIKYDKEKTYLSWNELLQDYFIKYPEMKSEWENVFSFDLPDDVLDAKKYWDDFSKEEASRASGGRFLNELNKYVPNYMGGSADLNGSTKTYLKDSGDFNKETPEGKNIFFGVREHAMAAILNGLALHGGVRPFGATFLVFSDYMKPSIRLSALMGLPVVYVFTHDSIGVGEDGPTHQPIEHLMLLRSIPGLMVYRPADPKETTVAWTEAMKYVDGPSAIVLSRQNLPSLTDMNENAHKGAYVLKKESKDNIDVILIATGSEVHVTLEAAEILEEQGVSVRVVSLLSWELFDKQSQMYKEEVLPSNVTNRVAVEAALGMGWEKYVGLSGKIVAMNSFGESAPISDLMKHFGFTADNIVKAAKQ